MSVKARALPARGIRAGRDITSRRKKFCRRCKTRVSRSAGKCGYCGARLLNPMRLALTAFAALALPLLFCRFLGWF